MKTGTRNLIREARAFLAASVFFALGMATSAPPAGAHCDTLDGPVVAEARGALEAGDVTPVLKWVAPDDADTIRAAFDQTLTVRRKGPEAKDLADRYFFETLVRVHRAGEGAPYTGLKPAGSGADPVIEAADKAIDSGEADQLIDDIATEVKSGLRERFERVEKTRKHKDESVEAGRRYVAAYVEFIHYAERLHQNATTGAASHASHEPGHETEHKGEDASEHDHGAAAPEHAEHPAHSD